jgi:hypothetical protein
MKTLEGSFVNILGSGRGGSNKIRDRPAPGIGAIYITRNRPVTSTGRGIPVRIGAGRSGSGRIGAKLPSLIGAKRLESFQ